MVAEPFTSQRCHACEGQLEVVLTRLKQREAEAERTQREAASPDVGLSGNRHRDVVGLRPCQAWHAEALAS